jgi:alpha,alpha-trehalase
MLVEIARFWASIATYHAEHDRYEIRGVMGPDEFHTRYPDAAEPGLDNNAYTNVMAAGCCAAPAACWSCSTRSGAPS